MQLHDLPADGESQAGPGHRACAVAREPLVTPEDPVDELGCDADSVVLHRNLDRTVACLAHDLDLAAVGRILDRVAEQVGNHLDQSVCISAHEREREIEVRDEVMPLGCNLCALDRVFEDAVQVDRTQLEVDLARLHAVQVEHLSDHPIQPHGVAVDVTGEPLDVRDVEIVVADQLAEALDADQGGPELVADHGDELAFHLVQALEPGEVLHRDVLGLVSCGHVLGHREEVIE